MALFKLRGVHKRYRLGAVSVHALRGVDLDIHEGEFAALWGPSGSGKSTLCHLLGLIDGCSSGSLEFKRQDVAGMTDGSLSDTRNREIGFIFQSFNLIPVLTALENVMLPLQVLRRDRAQIRDAARELLEVVGLSELQDHRPDKLSGGQQQRVAIARALVTNPAVVVADEPTANLDSVTALEIIGLMRDSNRNRGTTFIFSTHDERLLKNVDRLLLLDDGRIVEDRRGEAAS